MFTDEPQSRVDGWMDGNIYSLADVADKYGNQTRLVVFVRDYNIFGFLFLFFFFFKKKHILEGKKKHVRIREIERVEAEMIQSESETCPLTFRTCFFHELPAPVFILHARC